MVETEDLWLALFIVYFVGFFSGLFVRTSLSQYRRHNARKERETSMRGLPPLKENPHDGKKRGMNLPMLSLLSSLFLA
jgi:hypothetical protein